jgi:NadR type nicotinamide-nucleotide adenylyltransferase
VCVDGARERIPVSGRAVRRDPAAHWAFLAPVVRAWYVRRIAVVGAESTGTTTMARSLAASLATAWVPEYGRDHAAAKVRSAEPWTEEDFVTIARTQQSWEDEAAERVVPGPRGPLLICDTDALATSIWHERYMGRRSAAVDALAASRRYTLYLLTVDDIAFVQDGTRDGEHLRRWMTERFRVELRRRDEPVVELRGSHEERLARAVEAVASVGPPATTTNLDPGR